MSPPDARKNRSRLSRTLDLVSGFQPQNDRGAESRRKTLDLLGNTPNPFDRTQHEPGHITGSGLVLAPVTDRVLIVYHDRLERWLQPGGHVEQSDEDVLATALREIGEETGVKVFRHDPELLRIDVHHIPANRREPAHLHYDLMFRFVARNGTIDTSEEGRRVAWCSKDELVDYGIDDGLREAMQWA